MWVSEGARKRCKEIEEEAEEQRLGRKLQGGQEEGYETGEESAGKLGGGYRHREKGAGR